MATELGKAYVQIIPSAKGISGSIQKAINPESKSAGESAGKSLAGNLAKVAMKAIAVAGIGKAFAASISEGANLQQSLGGIETLFKGSADKVKKYADNAYKTSGLSANDYMQNVTKFSASLLQSLGGNTEKSADIAEMAMIDMSDNANKMGTSIGDIQNAYQGFAKKNYTMLDNLRLGYGGTQEEMKRLLADATKLTGVKYDINNLSDVYEAIHAIQENLDITGTTAKEASETFSGSFAAMKASASNVLGKLALGQDIKPSLKALAETTSTFLFDNFIPMVVNILKGLPEVFGTLASEAGKRFASMLGIDLDFSGLGTAVQAMGQWFTDTFTQISTVATPILQEAGTFIMDVITGIVDFVADVFSGENGVANSFMKTFQSISDIAVPILQDAISFIRDIIGQLTAFWEQNGTQIASAVQNAFSLISSIISGVMKFIEPLIKMGWNNIKATFQMALGIIMGVVKVFASALTGDWKGVLEGIKQIATSIWNGIKSTISNVLNGIKGIVTNVWNVIKSLTSSVFNGIKSVATRIWNGIKSTISNVVNGIKSKVTNIWNGIKSTTSSVFNGIKSTATRVWNGVKSAMTRPIEAAKNTIKRIVDSIKGFFSGMNLRIPSIKMPPLPHFSLTGKFSLNPPSVPKLGITWNAKGGIFTRPTIFGMNGGNLQGAGEAGAEAVLPLNSRTLAGIGKGISDEMGGSSSQIELLERKLEQMIALLTLLANQDTTIEMDDKTVAKILAPIIKQINDKKELLKNRGKGLITT